MTKTYVPAVIQSIGTEIGHNNLGQQCSRSGTDCWVRFGSGEVNVISYVLYSKAIATALEGLVAIFLMGIADYSNYRKCILIFSILVYGVFALPFVGLTSATYANLVALTVLYILLNIDDAIYQILEGSYIPLFMRAAPTKINTSISESTKDVRRNIVLQRGATVSVMGLVLSNMGGITALIIGIIISYTRGSPASTGYHNFMLAITIAGGITIIFAIISAIYIPSAKNRPTKTKPKGEWLLLLSIKRFFHLLKDIQRYPQAFLYCIAWVIWNVSFTNFASTFGLLFRSTLGLGSSDPEYTVYSFMTVIIACLGSLLWMYMYPRLNIQIKTWGYFFLGIQVLSNFWGCLGTNKNVTAVGFMNAWEFWLFEVLFNASASSMRSLNRVVYSSLLPEGNEAQYFGLEIMLGVATGWIGTLVNAIIQDRTGNPRYPFLPNLFVCLLSILLYYNVDFEKGMNNVRRIDTQNNSRIIQRE